MLKRTSIIWESFALVLVVAALTPFSLPLLDDFFIQKDPEEILVRLSIVEDVGYYPDEIRVKKGQPVKLILMSMDVAHGFEIESLYVNAGIIHAGQEVVVEFTPKEVGEFEFKCTMLCSPLHSLMKGKIIVED